MAFIVICSSAVSAQSSFQTQCNNFNYSFTLSTSQIQEAGITSATTQNINVGIQYERSNWAHGPVDEDAFYAVPNGSANAPAGSVLKAQIDANVSDYTLPANTAIWRILFQTKTLDGTLAPASAYILWPFMARPESEMGAIRSSGLLMGPVEVSPDVRHQTTGICSINLQLPTPLLFNVLYVCIYRFHNEDLEDGPSSRI
jgi:hypothetical protein